MECMEDAGGQTCLGGYEILLHLMPGKFFVVSIVIHHIHKDILLKEGDTHVFVYSQEEMLNIPSSLIVWILEICDSDCCPWQ